MDTKIRVLQISEKLRYLISLLVLVFTFVNAGGQQFAVQPLQDSLLKVQQDSLLRVKQKQDSLAQFYIFVRADRPNLYLDSLRSKVVVADNDFIGWMEFVNGLSQQKHMPTVKATEKYERPAWVIGVLMLLFLGLGLVRLFFYHTFQNIIYGFFNDRILGQISKEDNVMTSWPYIFLYVIFSFSMGLFILIYQSAFSTRDAITVIGFLKISAIVALLFVAKILLIRIISVIFEVERLVREYIAVLYLVYFNSMLVLMPLLVLITFFPASYFKIVLIFFLITVSILFLYRFLRTAFGLVGNLKFSIFYLILYLCSLEIAPILILVKTLNS